MDRVTYKDLAKKLEVSYTTIYKALNDKPGVSDETRWKIRETAKEMYYRPNKSAKGLARNVKTIGFIIPLFPTIFNQYIKDGIENALVELSDINILGIIRTPETQKDAEECARELIIKNVNGIIIMPNENVQGIRNVIENMGADIPIVSILSEPVDKTVIAGIFRSDGNILGMMAAQLLSFYVDPKKELAIFIPDTKAVIHAECIAGFTKYCRENGLGLTDLCCVETGRDNAYRATKEIIRSKGNLGGIYVATYNSVGVCECIEDMGRRDIKVIGHDLYPESAECLKRESLIATLFQNQYSQAKQATYGLANYITGISNILEEKVFRPEVVLKSNLSLYRDCY